ncbi:hypothetical protein KCU78_g33, partial [Aureobasidium melanogenum]
MASISLRLLSLCDTESLSQNDPLSHDNGISHCHRVTILAKCPGRQSLFKGPPLGHVVGAEYGCFLRSYNSFVIKGFDASLSTHFSIVDILCQRVIEEGNILRRMKRMPGVSDQIANTSIGIVGDRAKMSSWKAAILLMVVISLSMRRATDGPRFDTSAPTEV